MAYLEALTAPDIDFGTSLWRALRNTNQFPFNGVFWLFEPETDEWRLMIATPRLDVVGPKNAYTELAEVTKSIPGNNPQLRRIQLISPKHPFYQALRTVFGQKASVEGTRLGNTQIGGTYIDDAYLYEIR